MPRLIDADELYRIEKMLDTNIVRQNIVAHNLLEQVLYDIKHIPDVDAEPVVHCSDCLYLMFSDCYGECKRGYLSGIVRPDDYCSRGERKEDNT